MIKNDGDKRLLLCISATHPILCGLSYHKSLKKTDENNLTTEFQGFPNRPK